MKNSCRFWVVVLLCSVASLALSQDHLIRERISLDVEDATLPMIVEQLDQQHQLRFLMVAGDQAYPDASFRFEDVPLNEAMEQILGGTDWWYTTYRDYLVVVAPRLALEQTFSNTFFRALEASQQLAQQENEVTEIVIGSVEDLDPNGQPVVVGRVLDAETGEEAIGATVIVQGQDEGTATDAFGHFELPLDPGNYTLEVQYIGYQGREIPVHVISSGNLEITLNRSSILLDEVVVEAQARDDNIQSVQVGVTRINVKDLEKLPSFLGEVDVIKGLLLQSGVTTIGEGSSGFNVRGGGVDQNLIIMDEAMIFNASHALGFFSSFNSDIISDALLFKGNIPARYGGRLASVLDVNVRDGNFERMHLKGGLGLVTSRLTMEGPVIRNKTSFLISGRSSYSDWLLKRINVPEIRESSAFFYDAHLRLTHRFNEKNFLALSYYATDDEFSYANQFGFEYGTDIAQLNYRSQLGQGMLSTLSAVWSRYESTQSDLEGTNASQLSNGIEYLKIKENVNLVRDRFEADAGFSAIWYRVDPGNLRPEGPLSLTIPRDTEDENGLEMALYANARFDITSRLSVEGGLRYSIYQFLGPQRMFTYNDPSNPTESGLLEEVEFSERVIHSLGNLEPRISARYRLNTEASLKFGYARTTQYINQIFNNDTPTPTSLWQLSNQYIPPSLSHNFSLGYFRNFDQNIWITSLELFYRYMDQQLDFKDFADLIANNHVETEILSGIGRAAGLELSIRKQVGTVNGSFNYTLSRTERKIADINDGSWYPSTFDKPHDLNLVTTIQLNKRNQLSFNFSYSTGRPTTIPIDRHLLSNRFVVLNYSDRNAFRIPDYHRLDIAYTIGQGYRKSKKFKTSWTISVYNVYSRRNAFSVFIEQDRLTTPEIRRLAVLGSAFPSLTFNFELL